MSRKINHIGIAVKSIESVFDFYNKTLGLEYLGEEEVAEQKVKVAFFQSGESRIELLEATSDDSPIAKFISKKGEGIHHLAFSSENILDDLESLIENNIRIIDKTPRAGAHNTKIAFLHPKASSGVLVELTENR
jgi:methylmalonyl-CoA/ethylmalonyl-CoA epimerase